MPLYNTVSSTIVIRTCSILFTDALPLRSPCGILFSFSDDFPVAQRDLKPDNIVIFSDALSWKLIDFGSWAKKGSTGQLEYTLRYAAPELLSAHATEDVIQVMPSSDMWSLGLIFWEVLTGDPLFGQEFSKEEV